MTMKTNRLPAPGDRVAIHTITGGCYDGLTGVITGLKDSSFQDLAAGQGPDAHWWSVALDRPADNGGKEVHSEIFLARELRITNAAGACRQRRRQEGQTHAETE